MIHLFINALAASAGGGLTYLRNLIPHLAERNDLRATILLPARLQDEFPKSSNLSFLRADHSSRTAARFWFEQCEVRRLIRQRHADVLLSPGNFAIGNSPVPQILLSRNSLYTSRDFEHDLRDRGEYRMWIDTHLKAAVARWSVATADCTVAPSEAFARELQRWTGKEILAIHHGFDRKMFLGDESPLPADTQQRLAHHADAFRLLFVSHYNYYRNFETLFRAIPLIKKQLAPKPVVLFLTCKLAPGANSGNYRTDRAAALVRELGISNGIVELGAVPYRLLHQVYQSANVYVTPAYAETFAHPLVESMSSGLPVVASDLAVHREVCQSAALFFERFSEAQLADRVVEIARSAELTSRLSKAGLERSGAFSWKHHVESIINLATELASRRILQKVETSM